MNLVTKEIKLAEFENVAINYIDAINNNLIKKSKIILYVYQSKKVKST